MMDDGMLGDEMTLKDIGKQLYAIQVGLTRVQTDVAELKDGVAEIKTDVVDLKTDVAGLKTDVAGLKTDVASLDHRMTVQFEETRSMLRFGLEAREALRESMEQRFDEADRKHDFQIALLQDVVRDIRGQRLS
jgi:hypothetical protein